MKEIWGGIEAGGTHFVCAIGSEPNHLKALTAFPTTTPDETIRQVIYFFQSHERPTAIGVASFGPLELDLTSLKYGTITSTPKQGWTDFNIIEPLHKHLDVPIGLDTDVNAAALAEYTWGNAQGIENVVYLAIGTGIGAGVIANGQPIHGLIHPEIGHLRIPHEWERDKFPGVCPFHGDCFEGLASGPAMMKRWGVPPEGLNEGHPGWELESEYLALGLANIIYTLSPERIILGGGVMQASHLLPLIRTKTQTTLNQYLRTDRILNQVDSYIVSSALGPVAGVLGALILAQKSAQDSSFVS